MLVHANQVLPRAPRTVELRCLTPLRVRLHEPAARRARSAVPNALHGSARKAAGARRRNKASR